MIKIPTVVKLDRMINTLYSFFTSIKMEFIINYHFKINGTEKMYFGIKFLCIKNITNLNWL